MANNPFGGFGPGMAGNPRDWSGQDFDALSRQYWNAWGEALRAASGQPVVPQGMQGWHDAVDWWSKLAHGGRSEANDLVERFNAQARHWFGQMQQVAAQFSGQDQSAAQIAEAWKRALGAAGENPFPEIFRAMRGHGQQGLEQWVEDASPYLDAMRREGMSWLSLPAFGIGREHQERLQALARAQVEYQEKSSAYNALMLKAGQRAFELFEDKLAEREEPGRQLASARALFDLWIDAAEESYAEIALSQEFRHVYGALVNAQMRLRSGIQKEVELASGLLGMPTRSEMDAAHRKVAELERQVRRMRDASQAVKPAARTAGPAPQAALKRKPQTPSPPVVRKTRPKKKTNKPAKAARAVRAASKPARRAAPVSLLSGITAPVAPAAMDDAAAKPTKGSKRR
ncbi:class III poly(R)-hydroxyalkanoic acid synthase subunit PhaE [Lysobacter sp. M15]|uniref:class III poly(R)-hydroxyalkanoic acid synthase subunit PhaE n=1 Tax=Lysobacter sp. M15 TaxID=2916837 RepID=UPI001F56C24B|nr:class III poly(R)-hydroxyalkanoic acid synthase subunit PhaE [Lysobacter sp. M15]